MFTRNGAMVGIVTGAVTAGMGVGMIAPMVAYADQTTDDGAQTQLTDTQKSYLKSQIQKIQKNLKDAKNAATDEGFAPPASVFDHYITSLETNVNKFMADIDSGDRAKASAVKTSLEQLASDLKTACDEHVNSFKGTDDNPTNTYTAYKALLQSFGDASDAFTQVVEKNQDPDSAEFDGLSWSDTMKVTTYTSTFEEDYGMYANFDLSYKRTSGADGYMKWEMPQELADNGFTIVTTGMLAPQASIPTYGDSQGSRAPEMYVSADKKSIIVEIPPQVDANGHANGTFSFAIHSDKKQSSNGEKLDAFIVAKTENGDFAHVPQPKALKGELKTAVAQGYTKQATMGTREAKHTFTIKFNTNGGSVIPDRTVTDGNLANFQNWAKNLPSTNKTGFRFLGWFTDEACTKVFDPFQTELTDMTLYAKFVQTVQPESTNAARTAPTKGDLVHTGDTNAYIATVAAVTVGAGIAVTVLRRRSK